MTLRASWHLEAQQRGSRAGSFSSNGTDAFYSTRFGAEKGHKAGPDNATTTVGEAVRLKLQAGGIKVRRAGSVW